MNDSISNLKELLSTMEPILNKGVYVYSSIPFDSDMSKLKPIAIFKEQEGLTIITDEQNAIESNLHILFSAAWITLKVQSDLKSVGLTAAFSTALGNANISCNVVAGAFHDHIFVPIEASDNAMKVLLELQRESQKNLNR
ncbi:MAG: ACT domain-containing protein [Vulcanibacillus sp.]